MNEVKHTPGPWHTGGTAFLREGPRMNVWSRTAKGDQSGEILAKDVKPANARLMAAAPELIAVTREMCRIIAFASPETLVEALKRCYDDAREAIDKAEGRL